jgi:hypothetical protein
MPSAGTLPDVKSFSNRQSQERACFSSRDENNFEMKLKEKEGRHGFHSKSGGPAPY